MYLAYLKTQRSMTLQCSYDLDMCTNNIYSFIAVFYQTFYSSGHKRGNELNSKLPLNGQQFSCCMCVTVLNNFVLSNRNFQSDHFKRFFTKLGYLLELLFSLLIKGYFRLL